jgi:1,4-dihydroxy-2-naphthoate octaprenyltransferase
LDKNVELTRATDNLGTLIRVIRPHIVAGGLLGYLLGALLALNSGAAYNPVHLALGYAVVLAGDLSTHYSNDYHDVEIDSRSPPKMFGRSNALVAHPEARPAALVAAVAFTAASLAAAAAMVAAGVSTPTLLLVAAAALALGWMYSSPPTRLNARGLGEATIAVGTGFAVPAVGYMAAAGALDGAFLLASAPLVLYGFVLSICLELPDMEVDRSHGKTTLVVALGRRRAVALTALATAAASVIFAVSPAGRVSGSTLPPLLSLAPLAAALSGAAASLDGPGDADRVGARIIAALFIFLVAFDGYLLHSLLT